MTSHEKALAGLLCKDAIEILSSMLLEYKWRSQFDRE